MFVIRLASTFNPHGLKGEQIFIQNAVQNIWFSLHPNNDFIYNLADETNGTWFEFDLPKLDRQQRSTLWEALTAALGPHYDVVNHGVGPNNFNMYIGFHYSAGEGKFNKSEFLE